MAAVTKVPEYGDGFYVDSEGIVYEEWGDILISSRYGLERLTLLEGHRLDPKAPARCPCGATEFTLTPDESWNCDITIRCVKCGHAWEWRLDCA